MEIAGYLKTSLIEWPGKITSVIFTSGCNFRCPFCHNADLVLNKKPFLIKVSEVLVDLEKRKKWTDAVVVTGGEPTLQPDLDLFLQKCKNLGFLTMVHTNGTNPLVISKLLGKKLVDSWAMDLKGDFENYEKFTGIKTEVENIKKSLQLIAKNKSEFELRTTVVPRLHNRKNLAKLAGQLKKEIENFKLKTVNYRWFLQQFQPINCLDKKYLKIVPYSKQDLEKIYQDLQKIIPEISLRGV